MIQASNQNFVLPYQVYVSNYLLQNPDLLTQLYTTKTSYQNLPQQIRKTILGRGLPLGFNDKQIAVIWNNFVLTPKLGISQFQSLTGNTSYKIPALLRSPINTTDLLINQKRIQEFKRKVAMAQAQSMQQSQPVVQQKMIQQPIVMQQVGQQPVVMQQVGQQPQMVQQQMGQSSKYFQMGLSNNMLNQWQKLIRNRQKPFFRIENNFVPSNYTKTNTVALTQNLRNFDQNMKNISNLQQGNYLHYFPQWSINLAKNAQTKNQLFEAMSMLNTSRYDPTNQQFAKLSNSDPAIFWDENNKIWRLPQSLEDFMTKKIAPKNYQKTQQLNQWIANNQLNDQELFQYVPPLVRNLIRSNETLSTYGIGPISDNSLPFYAGRWIDPTTNRIRLLPQASNKFINPLKRQQKLGYLQAMIINKWNKFVQVQQQYLKLKQITDEQYQQKQRKSILKPLSSPFNLIQVLKWYKQQAQLWYLGGAGLSKNTKMFLNSNINGKSVGNAILQIFAMKISNEKRYNLIQNSLIQYYNLIPPITPQTTKIQQKQLMGYRTTCQAWVQKGRTAKANAFKKLLKTAVPQELTQAQVIKAQEYNVNVSSQARQLALKSFNPNQVGLIKAIQSGKLGQIAQYWYENPPIIPDQQKISKLGRMKIQPPKVVKPMLIREYTQEQAQRLRANVPNRVLSTQRMG